MFKSTQIRCVDQLKRVCVHVFYVDVIHFYTGKIRPILKSADPASKQAKVNEYEHTR